MTRGLLENAPGDALLDSKRRQDAVSATGFDWPDISGVLDKVEEEHIRRVLASVGSLQETADILGIDHATLWRRRKQYGI